MHFEELYAIGLIEFLSAAPLPPPPTSSLQSFPPPPLLPHPSVSLHPPLRPPPPLSASFYRLKGYKLLAMLQCNSLISRGEALVD